MITNTRFATILAMLIVAVAAFGLTIPTNVHADGFDWESATPTYDSGWDSYSPSYDPYWDSYTPTYNDYSWDSYSPSYDPYWDSYTPTYNDYSWDSYSPSYDPYWDSYTPTYGDEWDSYTPSYNGYTSYDPIYTPGTSYTSYDPVYTPGGYSYDMGGCYTYTCSGYTFVDTPVYVSDYVYDYDYSYDYEYVEYEYEEYVYEWEYEYEWEDHDYDHGGHNKPRPDCDIYASDTQIEKGDSTTLHWDSNNASSASLSGHGSVSTDGSKTVSPESTKTYTLTVSNNKGKTATCETTVKVKDKPQHDYQPVCALSASDETIEEGDSTTLHWTSENATSATLTSFGDVSTGGSRSVSPTSDKTYTLTVRDNDGDTDTCSVHINVEEEEEEEEDDLRCELDASDTRVDEGDRVTLEWEIDGEADYASINRGIGRVDEDGGEERVTVDRDTTYTLTVRNDDDEDTCSVTVRVDEENDFSSITFEGEPTYNPPVVYLSDIPYTGLEDINPTVLSFWVLLIAMAGAGTWFAYRSGFIPTFAFATAEPIDEGHEDGHVDEGHATEATPEAAALISALSEGDTSAAVNVLRDAAVNGAGVEETLESASLHAPENLKDAIDAALAGSRETGIRGAKDALGA